jgi:hypothetical protein
VLRQLLNQYLLNFIHVFNGCAVLRSGNLFALANAHSQVLGHEAFFNSLDDSTFKDFTEVLELTVVVKLSSMHEASGPSVNRSNGVG